MELIGKKTQQIIVRRTQEEDFKKIYEFHKNKMHLPQPDYLRNTLENFSGISLAAYKADKLLGHILAIPLSSQQNIAKVEAAVICGVWALETSAAELLVKDVMMSSWEEGYHVLFAFENFLGLKKFGFQPVGKEYFVMDFKNYALTGAELSWSGFDKISKDLILPKTFLPPSHQLKSFSNN